MATINLETRINHHEFDDLKITIDKALVHNGSVGELEPVMTIAHVEGRMTLTLHEIDALKDIADKYRSAVLNYEDA